MYFKVMFDFTAEEDGELSVYAGEVVRNSTNASAEATPDGWILVHSEQDGASGFVPRDYLEETVGNALADNSLAPTPNPQWSTMSNDPNFTPEAPRENITEQPAVEYQELSNSRNNSRSNSFAQPLAENLPPPPSTAAPLNVNITSSSNIPPPPMSLDNSLRAQAHTPTSTPAFPTSLKSSASFSNFPTTPGGSQPKGKGISALIQASKKVISMNKSVGAIQSLAPPKIPSLVSAVDRDNFEELLKRNDDYFTRVVSSQAEAYNSLTGMVDVLSKKLGEANQSSNDFVQKLTELDELIDEERRKWKLQNEAEKNAIVMERSAELAGRSAVGGSATPSRVSSRPGSASLTGNVSSYPTYGDDSTASLTASAVVNKFTPMGGADLSASSGATQQQMGDDQYTHHHGDGGNSQIIAAAAHSDGSGVPKSNNIYME